MEVRHSVSHEPPNRLDGLRVRPDAEADQAVR